MNEIKRKKSVKTMKELEACLQRADRKQAFLYLFCNFVSLMLITAYSGLMLSPVVQNIFPEGGDSRKQMYAIFVLALFGCTVFTVYAASLFFRKKSRQLGILMALGASRKTLAPGLFREVLFLSGASSLLGILTGFPFLLLLWNLFRFFIVDTEEMTLGLDFRCLWISAAFMALVLFSACLLSYVYLRKTNLLDVIQEEHQNEPVKELGTWCGPAGILLLLAGAVMGYKGPSLYQKMFHRYSPGILDFLLYTPVFAGLYMIMLHTVVNGWTSRRKNFWKNIISRSMMKFQGKQTVNSLLVTTVLIAGGCFGIFYLPMLSTGLMLSSEIQEYDYYWFHPSSQQLPSKEEITSMAEEYQLNIQDWKEIPYLSLAYDSICQTDNGDGSFSEKYYTIAAEAHVLSETDYNKVTGQNISLEPGSYYAVTNAEETSYHVIDNTKLFTNMSTQEALPVSCAGILHYEMFAGHSTAVVDDSDYQTISRGLTPEWKGTMTFFNSGGEDRYSFAYDLFLRIVYSYDDDHFANSYYDPVEYLMTQGYTNNYYGVTSMSAEDRQLDRTRHDSSDFRMYWGYMPMFRILNSSDMLQTFAVFLMSFLFIAIVCFAAALVISYTRCQTIALNNAYLFYDLKRLGASPAFLAGELKRQAGPVFKIPAASGISIMVLLYIMILYANDGTFTHSELMGFLVCLEIIAVIALIFYAAFRRTLYGLLRQLEIFPEKDSRAS